MSNASNSRKGEKHKSLTISEKLKILECIENGASTNLVCEQFELKKSTFYDIKRSKEKILSFALFREEGWEEKKPTKRIKGLKYEELDAVVYNWYKQERSMGIEVRSIDIQEAAKRLAVQLGIFDFRASGGWLFRFQARHGISGRRNCGERSVDVSNIDPYRMVLPVLDMDGISSDAAEQSEMEISIKQEKHDDDELQDPSSEQFHNDSQPDESWTTEPSHNDSPNGEGEQKDDADTEERVTHIKTEEDEDLNGIWVEEHPIVEPNDVNVEPEEGTAEKEYPSIKQLNGLLSVCNAKLVGAQRDEFDGIGNNIAIKLRRMPNKMRIIAEKLINEVLFKAELNSLDSTCSITSKRSTL